MPFAWSDLLDLAVHLQKEAANLPSANACFRTALNRAYFAAYGHARSYAIRFLGFPERANADDHGRLRAHLRQKKRARDGARLDDMRLWRNEADYEEELSFEGELEQTVANAIHWVNSFSPAWLGQRRSLRKSGLSS
jgi:hypothetical protein